MRIMLAVFAVSTSLTGFVQAAEEPPTHAVKEIPQAQLSVTTRIIPLGIETNRMRGLTFDGAGTAWIGVVESDRRRVVKADPISGKSEIVLVTSEPNTDKLYMDHVIPIGKELFVCGGYYPRQIILDPQTGKSREFPLQKSNPEIFNAFEVNGLVYAFDTNNGIHIWNPSKWTSELIPWPQPDKGPFSGAFARYDQAFYCPMWWKVGMAETQPLLRFDVKTRQWTTLVPPWPNTKPMQPIELNGKLYVTDMFGGYMLVFDLASQKFEARHALPGYDQTWHYAASFAVHGPFIDCSLSTFAGVLNSKQTYGYDEHPHHFVNRRLLFDPRDGSAATVEVPSLSGDGYPTNAYSRPKGDSLYLTCVDSPLGDKRPQVEHGSSYLVELKVQRTNQP